MKLEFPDGKKKEFKKGITGLEIAKSIGPRLAKDALAIEFEGKIVDISPKSLTIEVTGIEDKIDALISMVRSFGIREIARTGPVALKREYYEGQERQS